MRLTLLLITTSSHRQQPWAHPTAYGPLTNGGPQVPLALQVLQLKLLPLPQCESRAALPLECATLLWEGSARKIHHRLQLDL